MNIRIGNEHPDSLLTYPDVANLSGSAQPIRMRSLAWLGAVLGPHTSPLLGAVP